MKKTYFILTIVLISMSNIYNTYSQARSDKQLGSFVNNGDTYFRLFSPDAVSVSLITFLSLQDSIGTEHNMVMDHDGVWEFKLDGEHYGMYYGYKVKQKKHKNVGLLCIDPYSKAVATFNTYMSPGRSIVIKEGGYDWEGDEWLQRDWRDLIIYEMHIRDITAHHSSGSDFPGTYQGLIQKGKKGGIDYIKNLGINTVELLPSQEFTNIEIPFRDSSYSTFNTWNPYERNHWGYMTSSFFAPESYFSEITKELEWNKWYGSSGKQVNDFKDMVKAFHKEGIAVIMDVVYNHISQYQFGNMKEIDKKYYFRLDDKGNYKSESGTGNDLRTEAPMVRRMIIESILYWMKEYHVDGFRFDLGKMIDWETVEDIIREAKKINPYVVFVCEPWGGGYDPEGFSLRGWGSWNDQIRNGVKGENPVNGMGWIFGNWYGDNNTDRIKSYINGTLVLDRKGLFQKKEHSVNYLESHDGYTLGDFIRIATKDVRPDDIIKDIDSNALLSPAQLKYNKLAALFLLTTQGIIMIGEGQEFARSKVIAKSIIVDKFAGRLDHNSYEKDNETNYLNYHHADFNKDLVDYYKGLILLRTKFAAFRRAAYEDISFFHIYDNDFALGYTVKYRDDIFIVLFNASHKVNEEFVLPEGNWEILVDALKAGSEKLGEVSGKLLVKPVTGFVLKKSK
jgi:pullulanase/glycogen debranching enzyme